MRSTLITLALILIPSLGFSQAPKFSFRTLGLANSKFPDLWVLDTGKPVAIAFSNTEPSQPVTADKTAPLKIFKGPLNDKGLPSDATPSLVSLPAASSLMLIGWMDDTKPGFLAIEDPFATMKSDDWLVINPTKSELAIQIGANAKTIPIKANSHQAIKNTAPAGAGAATTVAAKLADGKWKVIYNSYWPVFANQRGLVVVVQKGERYSVNYIPDKITPPAPDPKP